MASPGNNCGYNSDASSSFVFIYRACKAALRTGGGCSAIGQKERESPVDGGHHHIMGYGSVDKLVSRPQYCQISLHSQILVQCFQSIYRRPSPPLLFTASFAVVFIYWRLVNLVNSSVICLVWLGRLVVPSICRSSG